MKTSLAIASILIFASTQAASAETIFLVCKSVFGGDRVYLKVTEDRVVNTASVSDNGGLWAGKNVVIKDEYITWDEAEAHKNGERWRLSLNRYTGELRGGLPNDVLHADVKIADCKKNEDIKPKNF